MSAFLYQNPNYRQNNNIIGWSMKFIKKHINLIIVGLVILIACGVAFGIAMSGMKNGDYHYVAINTQADVEMILDKKHNVIATYPQNEKAKILLSNCDIIGSKVEDAVVSVLEQSCMLNFIDVDATEEGNNAVKMTVVSGLTNALELNVYRTINNFMLDNGIFCVIIENETDQTLLKQAKKESLSPDKYSLITSILDKSDWTFEKLKTKSGINFMTDKNQISYRSLVYDADNIDIGIKDLRGNIHEFPELNKMLYNYTGQKGILN